MSEPKSLCHDEPSRGLAPLVLRDIFRAIASTHARGSSVLFVKQNARYALNMASRGYVLQIGSITVRGPCSELREDARVQQAYLGRLAAVSEAAP